MESVKSQRGGKFGFEWVSTGDVVSYSGMPIRTRY